MNQLDFTGHYVVVEPTQQFDALTCAQPQPLLPAEIRRKCWDLSTFPLCINKTWVLDKLKRTAQRYSTLQYSLHQEAVEVQGPAEIVKKLDSLEEDALSTVLTKYAQDLAKRKNQTGRLHINVGGCRSKLKDIHRDNGHVRMGLYPTIPDPTGKSTTNNENGKNGKKSRRIVGWRLAVKKVPDNDPWPTAVYQHTMRDVDKPVLEETWCWGDFLNRLAEIGATIKPHAAHERTGGTKSQNTSKKAKPNPPQPPPQDLNVENTTCCSYIITSEFPVAQDGYPYLPGHSEDGCDGGGTWWPGDDGFNPSNPFGDPDTLLF
eukprot:TRINITY_DN103416_c0_g1_i1.p1 TRINITY_DN103416_c0_g1~~TRINITY_DN103416_c0_g1_i1.p1  ORF type:complete len:318 (+),score=27.18 TRINITY_DN103416_c0_g1_i1:91-1044(+)